MAIFVFIFTLRMTFVYVFVSEAACLPFNMWNSSSIGTPLLPSRGSSSPCQDLRFWHRGVRVNEEESWSKPMRAYIAGEGQSLEANPGLTNSPDSIPSCIIVLCLTTVHLAQGTCKRWIHGAGQGLRGPITKCNLSGERVLLFSAWKMFRGAMESRPSPGAVREACSKSGLGLTSMVLLR